MRPLCGTSEFVVCCGGRFDGRCVQAIAEISAGHSCPTARFVMDEWLEEHQLAMASLFWIVTTDASVKAALPALERGVPLLVPAEHGELKEICMEGQCGLYYETAAEAAACVIWLLENEDARAALGSNGRAHWERRQTSPSA